MSEKDKGGRPLKYKTVKELEKAIDLYFIDCDNRKVSYTIPGLAYALDFVDRQSLLDYNKRDKFSCTIKRSKLLIERQRLEMLNGGKGSAAGQIFDLKNNFKYRDQQDLNIDGNININVLDNFK